jgi:hypothetical protein
MKGRNRAEPIDHLGFADVAGMDNHVRPAKRIEGLRPQQAMRIRDDADNQLARAHQGNLSPLAWAMEQESSLRPRRAKRGIAQSCPMSSPGPRCLANPGSCGATACRKASHPG